MEGKKYGKIIWVFWDALMLLDVCSCTFQFESVEWFESFHFGRVSAWRMHFRMVSSMNHRHAGWSWVWPTALRGVFRIQRAISKAWHFWVDILLQWFEPAENHGKPTVVLCQVWKKGPLSSNSNSFQMRPKIFVGVSSSTGCLFFAHPWQTCLPGKTPKKDRVDRRISCNMPQFPSHVPQKKTRWKRAIPPINNHISYPCRHPSQHPSMCYQSGHLTPWHLTSKVQFFSVWVKMCPATDVRIKKTWLLIGGLEHEFYFSIYIENFIIPTDFHSDFSGRYTNQIKMVNPFR